MARLLVSSTDATNPSRLSAIKSTDVATVNSILAQSAAAAKAKSASSGKEVPPLIATRPDATDAADRANLTTQAVIGAKEGVAEALVEMLGRRITDAVLRTADGTDIKSIDQWEVYELVNALQQNAEQPKFADVRKNIIAAISHPFNLQLYF